MGSGGGIYETNDKLTYQRLNQKTVHVGASAPATTYDGMCWWDSANRVLKVYDNTGTAWKTLSNQSGSATTTSGTYAVTFPVTFASTPKVFCQINDGTDGIIKIASISTTGFTATIRIFSTSSFISDVTTPTGTESAHTHSVSGTSGTEAAHTHAITSTTASHIPQGAGSVDEVEVISATSASLKYCADASGGSPTTAFKALYVSAGTPSVPYSSTTGWSDITVVATVGSNTGAGSSHSHSVSITSGVGSSHSHTITHSHSNAVTSWTNGGTIGFNWLAMV